MSDITVEIQGLKETQAKMEQMVSDLQGPPLVNAMRDCTLLVLRDAKIMAPVDTGRLRASITPQVVSSGNVVQGIVGSNVKYAPFVEKGTRPHWPPFRALAGWARRHGMNEAQVWFAIGIKGTKAHPYLQPAFEKNEQKIVDKLGDFVVKIVQK
jgi:HK97 gp10 family phage protein